MIELDGFIRQVENASFRMISPLVWTDVHPFGELDVESGQFGVAQRLLAQTVHLDLDGEFGGNA